MSYNPGGWNDEKFKVYGILLGIVVVARLLYCWITGEPIAPPSPPH